MRAVTCGWTSAPWATASVARSRSLRHNSGSALFWLRTKVTGRPDSAARRRIHATSFSGATRSSHRTRRGELEHAGAEPPSARPMPNSSSSAANVPGTGSPSIARWASVRDVEKPSAPAAIPSSTTRAIASMSSAVAASLRAPLSHHVSPYRAMRDLGADVDRLRHAVEGVEVLGKGLPSPLDASRERGAGDVLDALHQPDEPVVLIRSDRREADAAVAHDDGRHPVPAARCEQRIPRDLPVEVCVDVHETWRHQRPIGVDLPLAGTVDPANLGDDTTGDSNIGCA